MKATFALAALFAAATLSPVAGFAADKPAAKGVKCGSSYIAAGKTCGKTAAPAKTAMTTPAKAPAVTAAKPVAAPMKTAAAKPAGKGVKCGKSYIAAGKKCTKG